jgi:diguanylate cyclase (GGDEF)-like protein
MFRARGGGIGSGMHSGFTIDLPTLFVVTIFVTATGGLLLLLSWLQNRAAPALAFWGLGYLIGATGAATLAARGVTPDALALIGGGALACLAFGVLWGGARCFEGRSVRLTWITAGAGLWLAACLVAHVHGWLEGRIALLSTIMATYALLVAWELWHARDRDLVSRWPTFGLVIGHAIFLLARIPFADALPFPLGDRTVPNPISAVFAFEVLFVAFAVAFLRLAMAKERAELEQRNAARIDPLTGIANRRAFFDLGAPLLHGAVRERRPAALLLFDLDRFKQLNDTAGHQAGDRVLKAFSDLVATAMRTGDLFGRIGGEEFACLITGMPMPQALQVAEGIRQKFETLGFACATVSIGVAMANEAEHELGALFATADRALYRAKAKGRNRVEPARAPLALVEAVGAAAG